MTYPLSSDVTSGQPTQADQYNNLRKDALTLGNEPADSLTLKDFLNRHFEHIDIQYLDTNRLRVPYSIVTPPTLMINGQLLQATANVDLPSNQFNGVAATWYVFAVRSAGSTTFTLAVNTSAAEATDQRLIGEAVWDGSNVISCRSYFKQVIPLAEADYDSGWFAVVNSTTYSKSHGLGTYPRVVQLVWCSSSTGSSNRYLVTTVVTTTPSTFGACPLYWSNTLIIIMTGTSTSMGTLANVNAQSSAGYYKILAWK